MMIEKKIRLIAVNEITKEIRNVFFGTQTAALPYLEDQGKLSAVIIGIDPSKTGYAVTVGLPKYRPIVTYELIASGSDMPVEIFGKILRRFWTLLFSYTHLVHKIGQEDALDLDAVGYRYNGANTTRLKTVDDVLLEIKFTTKNILYDLIGDHDVFKETYSIISNQTWKHVVLPKEYNKKSIKGSHAYLKSLDKFYFNVSDNMTDAHCIYKYTTSKNSLIINKALMPDNSLLKGIQLSITVLPTKVYNTLGQEIVKPYTICVYNEDFTLMQNIYSIANTRGNSELFVLNILPSQTPSLVSTLIEMQPFIENNLITEYTEDELLTLVF